MNKNVWSKLAGRMSTMGGFPGWSETMADNYFADLCDVPDGLAAAMIAQVQKRFSDRPSVKQLREWAAEMQAASSRGQLPDYLTPKALTGPAMANPTASVVGLLTEAGRETVKAGGTIPDAAKKGIRWLREQTAKDGIAPIVGVSDRGNWGLVHTTQDGAVTRLPARYSEAAAKAKADEQARKHTHLRVTVWCAESAERLNPEAIRLDREKEAA